MPPFAAVMAVIVVLSSPNTAASPDAAPRRIVTRFDSIAVDVVQLERDGTTAIAYVWMTDARVDDFESVVEPISDIELVERFDRADEGAFYKASWTVDSPLLQCVAAADGVVLGARGIPEAWRLTVLFEDRSSASSFQECCRTAGVPLAIRRLESVTEYFETSTETLTERQREALVLAYREGYFEEPRAASQAELAEELGISSSAFGRRLRQGIDSLIDDAVLA